MSKESATAPTTVVCVGAVLLAGGALLMSLLVFLCLSLLLCFSPLQPLSSSVKGSVAQE